MMHLDFQINMNSGSKQSLYLARAPCLCWSEPWGLAGAAPEPDPKLSSWGAAAEHFELSHGALVFPLLTPQRTAKHKGHSAWTTQQLWTMEQAQHKGAHEKWKYGTVIDIPHYTDMFLTPVARYSLMFYSCVMTHGVKRDVVFYQSLQFCPPALSQTFGAFPWCYKVPMRSPLL